MKRSILRWCIGIPAALVVLSGGLLGGVSLWLTPERLSRMASQEASEYLNADVELKNLRFTIWSSFPRFHLMSDSIVVRSRTLAGISPEIRRQLPSDCDTLLTAASFTGAVNVRKLAAGKIQLHDVELKGLDLNMVSVSDTLANYLIFPTSDTHHEIPEISANLISLTDPHKIRLFFLQSGLQTSLDLKEAKIKANDKARKRYASLFEGTISLRAQGIQILENFPFELKGNIGITYHPLRLSFSNYTIALGNLNAHASMKLSSEKNPGVESFSISTDAFRPLELLGYLPKALVPGLESLEADLPLHLQAHLTAPYRFSSSALPSIEVDADIPEGDIIYRIGKGEKITASDVILRASLIFDGERPDSSHVDISRLSMEMEGFSADVQARIRNILNMPQVEAEIALQGDLARLPELAAATAAMKPAGEVTGVMKGGFAINLSDSVPSILNLNLVSSFSSPSVSLSPDNGKSSIEAGQVSIRFSTEGNIRDGVPSLSRPTDVDLRIRDILWKKRTLVLGASALSVKGTAGLFTSPENAFDSLIADVRADRFYLTEPHNRLDISDWSTKVELRRALQKDRDSLQAPPPPVEKDGKWLSSVAHSPAYLTRGSFKGMEKFVTDWRMRLDLALQAGRWQAAGYPHPFLLKDTEIGCDFNCLHIDRMALQSGSSSAEVTLQSEGWRSFFAFDNPSPITADLRLTGGIIDINQIARATHAGAAPAAANKTASKEAPERKKEEEDVTPAWLLPRNLDAHLSVEADQTIYTNLNVSGLNADLQLQDGDLDVKHLKLATDFGHATLSAFYPTSDIQALSASASLQIEDVDVVKMFGKFHKLLEMAPQMKNLSGFVSVGGTVSLDIFPDMTTPMSSLQADLNVSGRQLRVKQDPFIHHLAKMMLIFNHKDIQIADMDVKANVHDNLLELKPFIFGFDKYRLRIEGVNNFNGDLDYHIGVLHSPIPLKFGISIEGTYHHPHLRFASPYWDVKKAWDITSHITKSFEWNFVNKMRWAGNEFMKKAASGTSL